MVQCFHMLRVQIDGPIKKRFGFILIVQGFMNQPHEKMGLHMHRIFTQKDLAKFQGFWKLPLIRHFARLQKQLNRLVSFRCAEFGLGPIYPLVPTQSVGTRKPLQ